MMEPREMSNEEKNSQLLSLLCPENSVPDSGIIITTFFDMESGERRLLFRVLGRPDEVQMLGMIEKTKAGLYEWGGHDAL